MPLDFINHVVGSSQALADLTENTDPSRIVPTCPSWTLADLCLHLAEVQRRQLLRLGKTDNPDPSLLEPLSEAQPPWQHLRDATTALAEEFKGRDPSSQAWNWTGANQTVAWAQRRQAHEATIHYFDAVLSVERSDEAITTLAQLGISTEFAVDGISEIVEVLLPSWHPGSTTQSAPDATVLHVIASDASESAWEIQIQDSSYLSLRPPSNPATLRIAAPSLLIYLWCWNRVELSSDLFDIAGDLTVSARYRSLIR